MQINFTDVLSVVGKISNYDVTLEMKEFSCRMGTYNISSCDPVVITIKQFENRKIEISSKFSITLDIPCDRCLDIVSTKIDIEIDKQVDLNESSSDRIEQLDESDYIDGYNLDVDKLVYGEILINLPMKTLCSEDCKGICNRCGTNLNRGECNCPEDEDALDPRMSVIRDIFKNFKEV